MIYELLIQEASNIIIAFHFVKTLSYSSYSIFLEIIGIPLKRIINFSMFFFIYVDLYLLKWIFTRLDS